MSREEPTQFFGERITRYSETEEECCGEFRLIGIEERRRRQKSARSGREDIYQRLLEVLKTQEVT